MIRLHTITHDVMTNTIEILHVEEVFEPDGVTLRELRPIRRVNYSREQMDIFIQEAQERAMNHMRAAGWVA